MKNLTGSLSTLFCVLFHVITVTLPYLPTVPILTPHPPIKKKGGDFTMCPYFCKNLSVIMYRKFRNVPNIFKDFPPIFPYFLGLRVGRYTLVCILVNLLVISKHSKLLVNQHFQYLWKDIYIMLLQEKAKGHWKSSLNDFQEGGGGGAEVTSPLCK